VSQDCVLQAGQVQVTTPKLLILLDQPVEKGNPLLEVSLVILELGIGEERVLPFSDLEVECEDLLVNLNLE